MPAIFEYIPYRKGDVTTYVDSLMHPYFAGHGYAAVRVDIRGSGESDGVLADEYNPREHDDALEILEWIAAQSWCTGAVGMIGLSWEGSPRCNRFATTAGVTGGHHCLLH